MDNKKISLFSKSFILGLAFIIGIASTFAITVNTTDTQWSLNNFDLGKQVTQNMILGQTLGYTCNNTDCSQKIYWKKISTTQKTQTDAAEECQNIGMVLPSEDQISYYAANNNRYGLNLGVYTVHNSMTNAGSWHHSSTRFNETTSCSTPGYTCKQNTTKIPNSWSNRNNVYGYNVNYFYCVYKRWH